MRLAETPRDRALDPALTERALTAGLADPAAFVRSAALALAEVRLEGDSLCHRVSAVADDADPVVAARARSLVAERCGR